VTNGSSTPQVFPSGPPERFERFLRFWLRHWLLWLNLGIGLYALVPWLSPLARLAGWEGLGQLLFRLYSPPICHQQPASSSFLGGYQVAYCQRDTAIYTTLFLAGLLFGLVRRRARPWPWWALVLCILPIGVDGLTQVPRAILPDWTLRTDNAWAVALTGGIFPAGFYVGDAVGSLNWLLRTVTGVVLAVGLVFTFYPLIEAGMRRATLST
jgi:uncharacterized membrane protein